MCYENKNRDKSISNSHRGEERINKRYNSNSNSPSQKEESLNRPRQIPDHQRIQFLSQPRKIEKRRNKLLKRRRLDLVKESLNLPTVRSPTSLKNSLMNIVKARIYGVEIEKFPLLKEQNKQYIEFKKKIKYNKVKAKNQKRMFSRTLNNSPEPEKNNPYENNISQSESVLPQIKHQSKTERIS